MTWRASLARVPGRGGPWNPRGVSLLVGSGFLLTSLALLLAPPVTRDGHPLMAVGQTYFGTTGGAVAGSLLTFAALRRGWRDLTRERRVLHVLGAFVVAAALATVVREG